MPGGTEVAVSAGMAAEDFRLPRTTGMEAAGSRPLRTKETGAAGSHLQAACDDLSGLPLLLRADLPQGP